MTSDFGSNPVVGYKPRATKSRVCDMDPSLEASTCVVGGAGVVEAHDDASSTEEGTSG